MKQLIYTLAKDQIIQKMAELGMSTDGTLDELRSRLSKYVSDNPQLFTNKAEDEGTSQETEASYRNDPTMIAKTINQMRKWGCQFDGKDPVSFLERIEELQCSYEYTDEQMLQGLPELLRGGTLNWYRNNRKLWKDWSDFTNAFREQYFPYRYKAQLKMEVQKRLQQINEPFRQYATDLATLMRRAGGFSRRDQIEQTYENMSPDLRLYIRRENIHTLGELCAQAAEIEHIEQQRRNLHANTRYTQRAPATAAMYNAADCCWRCKQRGHTRRYCRKPAKKFCSQCGKDGILTKDCHPRPGNDKRTEEQ